MPIEISLAAGERAFPASAVHVSLELSISRWLAPPTTAVFKEFNVAVEQVNAVNGCDNATCELVNVAETRTIKPIITFINELVYLILLPPSIPLNVAAAGRSIGEYP